MCAGLNDFEELKSYLLVASEEILTRNPKSSINRGDADFLRSVRDFMVKAKRMPTSKQLYWVRKILQKYGHDRAFSPDEYIFESQEDLEEL